MEEYDEAIDAKVSAILGKVTELLTEYAKVSKESVRDGLEMGMERESKLISIQAELGFIATLLGAMFRNEAVEQAIMMREVLGAKDSALAVSTGDSKIKAIKFMESLSNSLNERCNKIIKSALAPTSPKPGSVN